MTEWILRFIQNSRAKKTKRLGGPLTADETKKAELFWGKRVQVRATADGRYKDDLLQLNLQPNCDGVLECRGRVTLPDGQRYTEKLVSQAHLATLHGGVRSTMAKVREYYLGATAEEINQKDCEVLPWMSAVQGAGLYLSTPRESSKGSDRGPNTLPNDWSGLCRTFEVPEETKNRGKGLHPAVCLQPYRCRVCRPSAKP